MPKFRPELVNEISLRSEPDSRLGFVLFGCSVLSEFVFSVTMRILRYMFAYRKNSRGVGYFKLGWVTSVYSRREFRASRGGLLRGGLLLGYLHHGLRWVTSVDLQKESS